MKIVWDEPKRRANLEKHGFDFADVSDLDWASALIEDSKPDASGGRRLKAIGYFRDGTAAVIFVTLGTEAVSIISFRPASDREKKEASMATKTQKLKTFQPSHGYTKEDWNAVDFPELTDEELANMRPAKEVLPPEFFGAIEEHRRSRGRPSLEHPKKQVTLRLDEDVIATFRASGKRLAGPNE